MIALPKFQINTKPKSKKNKKLMINYGLKLKSNVTMNSISEKMPSVKLKLLQMKLRLLWNHVRLNNKEPNLISKSLKNNCQMLELIWLILLLREETKKNHMINYLLLLLLYCKELKVLTNTQTNSTVVHSQKSLNTPTKSYYKLLKLKPPETYLKS